jgi:hypothetical protein
MILRGGNERALAGMFARLDKLGGLDEAIIDDCANAIRKVLIDGAERGVDPYGTPWPLVQSGKRAGQLALRNVAKALVVMAFRGSVIVRLTDKSYSHHNFGAVRGGTARPIIPSAKRGIPPKLRDAVKAIIDRAMAQALGKAA